MKTTPADTRIYTDLFTLIAFKHEARGFDFLPRHGVKSPLYGRYHSPLRGRGLNLEELRQYTPGDDIRLMDWKATIRTGKPHVRTYTEERDRPALILVDQRIAMFFGSRHKMKSVVAAEVAALCAWRIISASDRVGAVVFNDDTAFELRPQRNPSAVLRMLKSIVDYNTRLRVGGGMVNNDSQLNVILSRAEQLCTHDFLVIIVSDLNGWDETSLKRIKTMARHNDVIALYVFDPLERQLPARGRYVVSDGRLQIEFDPREQDIGERFSRNFLSRVDALTGRLKKHGVPVMLVDTVFPAEKQIRRSLGERKGRR